MCWITLTPKKSKQSTSKSSCVEQVVRVHRSPSTSPRHTQVHVKLPSSSISTDQHHSHLHAHLDHHHPHLHPHIHPLHLHPLHNPFHHHHHHHHLHNDDDGTNPLHGPGHKRRSPSPSPSPGRPPSSASQPPKEPLYRTQIVEPAAIRAQTLSALQNIRTDRPRGRLRRVAGYEMLGRDAPWNWDCVSSSAGRSGSSVVAGGKWVRRRRRGSGGGGARYPPFGGADKWM